MTRPRCPACWQHDSHAPFCPEDVDQPEPRIPANHVPRTYAELVARSSAAHPNVTGEAS